MAPPGAQAGGPSFHSMTHGLVSAGSQLLHVPSLQKAVGKELELSEPKLNLWFFLDCVFRYRGNHLFFTDVLLHPEWFVAEREVSLSSAPASGRDWAA